MLRKRERDDLETNEEMNESGLLDLKALRKDHIVPMKGQPKSPGGNDDLTVLSLPSFTIS